MLKIILSFFSLLLVTCVSKQPRFEVPKNYKAPEVFLDLKNIRSPQFSADGKKLIYIQDFTSKSPQIFLLDLEANTKRQVTHQVGEIYEVDFVPGKEKIIYTSTTDEDKENPVLLRTFLNPEISIDPEEKNTEIYTSDFYGANIERLTKNPGYDGHFSLHPTSEEIIYTEKSYKFYRLRKGKKPPFAIYVSTKANEKNPAFSPNGNILAWVSDEDNLIKIQLRKKYPKLDTESIELKDINRVYSMYFHPQSDWLILQATKKEEQSDIFALHIETKCLIPLTFYPGPDSEAVFHPDGNSWYFISDRDGEKRLWRSTYFPREMCITEEAQ